jgi:SAM-dependent methyltransferase
LTLIDRAREIATFLGLPESAAIEKLSRGFHPLHADVAADFRRCSPKTDDELLGWYRTTDAYIWELSAYHLDPGFNYSGQCQGIAQHLKTAGVQTVLSLGDGIGDLSLSLHRAGFHAEYHDLAESRTAEFASFRFGRARAPFRYMLTQGWEPELPEGEYDAVVSLDFLEHVTDVPAWVAAIKAALKPGGLFCAQNAFNCGSGENGSIPCHLARNDKYETEWTPLLTSLGFSQQSSNWYLRAA